MHYTPPTSNNVTLEYGISQVRDMLNKASDGVLAQMYRDIAVNTHLAAVAPHVKKYWSDTIDILSATDIGGNYLMSDKEVSDELRGWFEKAYPVLQGREAVDFLRNIATGVLTVARRS